MSALQILGWASIGGGWLAVAAATGWYLRGIKEER